MMTEKMIAPLTDRGRRLHEAIIGFYLPVLLSGGADNFMMNLMIALLNHMAELMQLTTLIKAFSAGVKIGLIVPFIRFSLNAASRLNRSIWRKKNLLPSGKPIISQMDSL